MRHIDADALHDAISRLAEDMQTQADVYNERAKVLYGNGGEVSQYTWAVSLRETYRSFVKVLDKALTEAETL